MISVKKFGGTSVGTTDRIKAVAKRLISAKESGQKVVAVVSAMGDTTDELVRLAGEISTNPHPREYDALISTGENVSAALLSMCLIEMGHPAISLNGNQAGIKTEAHHMKAKVTTVDTQRITNELNTGNIVIITGFQGMSSDNNITTIGRGGSDTSAVIIAAALKCKDCEIYTDVDGVYTTDPRIESKASKLNQISYEEMLELAQAGAQVLHPRAVECAKTHDVTIHVRSSFEDQEGTRVKESKEMEIKNPVTGVAVKRNEVKLSLISVPDTPGIAADIFSQLGAAQINVDMIVQSTEVNGSNNITFTVSQEDGDEAYKILETIQEKMGASRIDIKKDIAKVSIVGVGMISQPGVAAKMFETLGQNDINIDLISTSEIKVSCAINNDDADNAVQLLHDAFGLDQS